MMTTTLLTSPITTNPIRALERVRKFHDAYIQVQRGVLQRQMLPNEHGRIGLRCAVEVEGNNNNDNNNNNNNNNSSEKRGI